MKRLLPLLLLLLAPGVRAQDVHDAIGLTALRAMLGNDAPTGAGIAVSQIEALSSGRYRVNPGLAEFSGKVIVDRSAGAPGFSSHANLVSEFWLGNTTGVAPGITSVDVFEAGHWSAEVLGSISGLPPAIETNRLQNHSWIANRSPGTPLATAIDLMRRFDFQLDRDRVLAVVTLNNGAANGIPDLLSHTYNALTIGVSDGDHSSGTTTFDTPGRSKPDLVAPETNTSFAAPLVSGAAALLLETIATDPALADAAQPETLKALLLAGATKEEFPGWEQSPEVPLDPVVGAGELNIFNSYQALVAGRAPPDANAELGWDWRVADAGLPTQYLIQPPSGSALTACSIALTWNRLVTDSDPGTEFNPQASVADLALNLYRETGSGLELIATSDSPVDNIEHLYLPVLGSESYVLEVEADVAVTFGVAWRSTRFAQPVLQSITPDGGNLRITADVTPGFSYRLERTNDGKTFAHVQTIAALSSSIAFIDEDPQEGGWWYRVEVVAP